MSIRRTFGIVVAIAGATGSMASSAGEWPFYQGNVGHTGYVPEVMPPLGARPTPVWTANVTATPEPIYGLAVGNGVVVTTPYSYFGNETPLTATRVADGTPLWSADFGSVFSLNQPAIDDDTVYVQVSNNEGGTYVSAYGLDGTFEWRAPFGSQWERYLGPIIVDGTLYFDGGTYGGLYAFDASNGSQRYYTNLPQYDSWSPTWDDGNLVVYTDELDVIDATTGSVVTTITDPDYDWRGYSPDQAPVVIGRRAYVTNYGRLVAFDLDAGTIAWARDLNTTGQIATDGVDLFVASGGALSVRDPDTGDAIWSWVPSASGSISTRIIVTDSHVIVGDGTSTYLVNRVTHRTDSTIANTGVLAFAEDTIFIGDLNGTVSAYRFVDEIFASGFEQ